MPISKERLKQINNLVNGLRADGVEPGSMSDDELERYSVDQEEEVGAFCSKAADPEELHAFADNWNWDNGTWPLEIILDNAACEAATALMIYWRACPEWFLQYADRNALEEAGDPSLEAFEFVTKLEQRYLAGDFHKGSIMFDPQAPDVVGAGEYEYMKEKFVRSLPPEMYMSVGPFQS